MFSSSLGVWRKQRIAGLGSRASVQSGPSKPVESPKPKLSASAIQRIRESRSPREGNVIERTHQIHGEDINIYTYLPEKYHASQFKEYTEIIEGIKQKNVNRLRSKL